MPYTITGQSHPTACPEVHHPRNGQPTATGHCHHQRGPEEDCHGGHHSAFREQDPQPSTMPEHERNEDSVNATLIVSDAIMWSRNIYIEYITTHWQYQEG
ncbi:hypothetical protein KIL84_002862 [Mauremys mutica]|uniref:Uncharacterized protein n=1 Tax=Mauremys mutica TaxID=74926 RepID=A0A9D3WNK0_9SAUR|nr:hypothetical protein KIL84_002862 [Mauremys mutica]